jgi:AcrR family transcriptional regulator
MARPKSEHAHTQVLETAAELFAERGIESTSMDAIARASGVSKATIYRHWPDKDALALEVITYIHGLDQELPVFDSGEPAVDFARQLSYDPAPERKLLRERIVPHLIAYASQNREFGNVWRARVLAPVRTTLLTLIERGKERGELSADLDPTVGLMMLLGPIIFRNVFVHKQKMRGNAEAQGPEDLEGQVARAFVKAFGVKAG